MKTCRLCGAAKLPLPPIQAQMYEYVTAANGVFVRGRRAGCVYFVHGDHLGSTSLTTDGGGNKYGEMRYKPYGETRYAWGNTPTDRRYTGQRETGLARYTIMAHATFRLI